jgi:hypothetical protein
MRDIILLKILTDYIIQESLRGTADIRVKTGHMLVLPSTLLPVERL